MPESEPQREHEGGRQGWGGARGEWEGRMEHRQGRVALRDRTQMQGQLEVETEARGVFVLGRGRPECLSESEAVEKEGELEGGP